MLRKAAKRPDETLSLIELSHNGKTMLFFSVFFIINMIFKVKKGVRGKELVWMSNRWEILNDVYHTCRVKRGGAPPEV